MSRREAGRRAGKGVGAGGKLSRPSGFESVPNTLAGRMNEAVGTAQR